MNPGSAPSFSFGAGGLGASTPGGFSFAKPAASVAQPTAAPATAIAPAVAPSYAFGKPIETTTAASTLPSFGASAATSNLPAFGATATATTLPAFGAGGTSTGLPSFGIGTTTSTFGTSVTSAAVPAFGAAAVSSALPSFGATTTAASALSSFGAATVAKTTASALSGLSAVTAVNTTNVGPPAGLTSTTATTQSSMNLSSLNYAQIEEKINEYTLELEEQEKSFINQATQINTWDNLLNSNSNKIIELSNAVEKVKSDQLELEHELEFIAAQHTELDECITPLQNELAKVVHMDMEKTQTYSLAENLDTQLRQMSEDLKEVIEHLNEANKLQNPNDPIVQIGRILNAHMNSLQWIESSTAQINSKLDDINKMYDTLRRDTERSLRLTYCD